MKKLANPEQKWIYKGKVINCLEDIEGYQDIIGFVYCITRTDTNKIYIGKKILHTSRKTRISKKEKLETGTRKIFKKVIKESDWQKYWGSSLELKTDMKIVPKELFEREILAFCYSKKQLSYCELEYQVIYDVLRDNSYNANILSRFFRKDLKND